MAFFRIFFLSMGPLCAAVAYVTVVRALRVRRAWRWTLGAALLLCSLKFTWFGLFGGNIFLPELPAGVIHVLSVCNDFVLVLAVMQCGITWEPSSACGRE